MYEVVTARLRLDQRLTSVSCRGRPPASSTRSPHPDTDNSSLASHPRVNATCSCACTPLPAATAPDAFSTPHGSAYVLPTTPYPCLTSHRTRGCAQARKAPICLSWPCAGITPIGVFASTETLISDVLNLWSVEPLLNMSSSPPWDHLMLSPSLGSCLYTTWTQIFQSDNFTRVSVCLCMCFN